MGNSKTKLRDMSESEFNKWMSKQDFTKRKTKYKIKIQTTEDLLDTTNSCTKTNAFVLPLSLEDNATISGTSAILQEIEAEFELHSADKGAEFLPYDTLNGCFDVDLARSRFEHINSLAKHFSDMAKFVQDLQNKEMHLEGTTINDLLDEESLNDESDGTDNRTSTESMHGPVISSATSTLENERRRFRSEDEEFWQVYSSISSRVNNAILSNNEEQFIRTVNSMATENLEKHIDHLKRSLLHVAIEKGDNQLAKAIISSGFNVNKKEGCGLTPLHLAIMSSNVNMVHFLIERNAKFNGPMFSSIPSPKSIAERLNLKDVVTIMDEKERESDEENLFVSTIDKAFCSQQHKSFEENKDALGRDTLGVVTLVIGDVGTCKTNCAVMARSCSFDWVGICIGDMHNKGYLNEACFKEHGQSGLHYIVHDVLKRKKLTAEAFKSREFQENFLSQIREANRDVCFGYCIAACVQFRESTLFPTNSELAQCMKSNGNHSDIMLKRFKQWLQKGCNEDVVFKHHSSTFCFYGPLMKLYDDSTRYGDGKGREVVFKLLAPVYAQLGFRNYFQETFRHVVNFTAKWPKVTRSILQDNCCVNLYGKKRKRNRNGCIC